MDTKRCTWSAVSPHLFDELIQRLTDIHYKVNHCQLASWLVCPGMTKYHIHSFSSLHVQNNQLDSNSKKSDTNIFEQGRVLLLNIILRIQSGVLEGQVLTDGWPDFTTVVSQVKRSSFTTQIMVRC